MLDQKVYRLLTALLLLSPQIPLVFMGDDHLSDRPFRFFADYTGDLANNVYCNRFKEAEKFGGYPAGTGPDDIENPNNWTSFVGSKLNWSRLKEPERQDWLTFVADLIEIRRLHVIPLLAKAKDYTGTIVSEKDTNLFIDWHLNGRLLRLRANASHVPCGLDADPGNLICCDIQKT